MKPPHTKPLYLFDLDGTLADATHRMHLIDKRNGSPDWEEFFRRCVDDAPIVHTIHVLNTLATHTMDPADIMIVSGRSDVVREQTLDWLRKHLGWVPTIVMRMAKDYTPDDVLKERWLLSWSPELRARIRMVFDDRKRVVDMWRRHGLTVAHMADGEF